MLKKNSQNSPLFYLVRLLFVKLEVLLHNVIKREIF
jgi:hypothetical protein